MDFTSTRNNKKKYSLAEVLWRGVAPDGGLFCPVEIPTFNIDEINSFSKKSYLEIAFKVIHPFLAGFLKERDLKKIIKQSYTSQKFNQKDLVLFKKRANNFFLLELFHGPTLAFKDFALQFLAELMNYFLKKNKKKILILVATSGDTGSASINAFQGIDLAKIFILHPHQAVSQKQRLQMTSQLLDNVFNIALQGNFDDCQTIVKEIFQNHHSIKGHHLVSVNSINFFRIVPQIVYYFYAFSRIKGKAKCSSGIDFVVPTGNFGNIFAGYLANKMGLPVHRLIIATNENDVLHRFIRNNQYVKKKLKKTFSPSMDIMVSSNFERLLFYIYQKNTSSITKLMKDLAHKGKFTIGLKEYQHIKFLFSSIKTSNKQTLEIIKWFYQKKGEAIDPHTATAVKGVSQYQKIKKLNFPTVILATAHPAKFDEVYPLINKRIKKKIAFKDPLKKILKKKERMTILDNSFQKVKKFINQNLS